MLWGSSMAVGAEAARRCTDDGDAIALALAATRQIVNSFEERAGTVNCAEVTGRKLDTFTGMVGLIFDTFRKGMDDSRCFVLAENWTPEAIAAAREGLETPLDDTQVGHSCASQVVRKMGGSDAEAIMVAGFGGGLGLSGDGCGALAAAMWMKGLQWCRAHPGKTPGPWTDTGDKNTLKVFSQVTGGEFNCNAICGREFETVDDHAQFIESGGCAELIDALAAS
jgi:hypothetical protein